jgi:hypothetical protein
MKYEPTAHFASANSPMTETELRPKRRRRAIHQTPTATVRLARALVAIERGDRLVRLHHATRSEARLTDGLVQLRCAAVGVRLALSARA